jgi:transcription elongation factor GreA
MSSDIEKQKEQIKNELDALKHEYTFELPKKISEAREHGDLKENADYHAARDRQGFVRARLAQLTDQLARLSNIDVKSISEDSVGFGSKVVIVDVASGAKLEFTFVTDGEANPSEGKITLSTPYGRALMGKKVGETATVTIPAGKKEFRIISLVTIHGTEINE